MLRWGPEFSGQNSPLITALSQVRILPGPPRLIVAASTGRVRIAADQGCQMHRVGIIPFDTRDTAVAILFVTRSEEHTSELQSLMRISYAVFCLKKKKIKTNKQYHA